MLGREMSCYMSKSRIPSYHVYICNVKFCFLNLPTDVVLSQFVYICNMNDINHRIKEVLDRSGLTAAEFAEALRVQRSSISHILSGRNKPSLDFITKLHSAFPDVDLTYLITGEESAVASPLEPTSDAGQPEPTDVRKTSIAENDVTNVNEKEPTPRVTFVNKPESGKLDQTENKELPATPPVTPSTRVSKIILLYEDGRFQEFTP